MLEDELLLDELELDFDDESEESEKRDSADDSSW